ncbi:MAG: sn-glycerol-3-phosphate import ATP-binding protein UgpC [Rhodospirillaceae bacterium]|nr:sn-glycerol-3-phosphate import ATP-binding protein UgpC [Rhodospirillaceae bacterium]
MATVDIRNARKTYPGLTVETIKGIDCAIADGEFLVMLGPSGCGKSTLLRMIAGLERVSAGEIAIGGRIVNDLEPKDRDIAMVFQNYALYPHMSVFDNMSYGLRIRRLAKAEINRRVREAAAILELGDFLHRKPRALSGGQRQRVAMGRAIVREPAVFLFDEPLSNLDAKLRTQMRVEIKRLQQRLGTTSLYVTHDQVEAMTLADRLMVMKDGVAEQVGTPLEVYRNPATVFVAGFIGSPAMNFLPGRVIADGTAVELPGGTRLNGHFPAIPSGQSVTVGIRPEHLAPSAPPGDGTGREIRIAIDLVEALGADTIVHGRLDGSPDDRLLARLPGSVDTAPSGQITLTAAPGALHLFDSQTGRSLTAAR